MLLAHGLALGVTGGPALSSAQQGALFILAVLPHAHLKGDGVDVAKYSLPKVKDHSWLAVWQLLRNTGFQ